MSQEGIDFDPENLMTYIDATYPDLRKCLNLLQANSITGQLIDARETDRGEADYKLEAVSLFKRGQIRAARELICSQVRPDEVEDFFVGPTTI